MKLHHLKLHYLKPRHPMLHYRMPVGTSPTHTA